MISPDVSIIAPVYNAKEYLPRCLDSITGQTLQNWELLLVDDGSTDGSGTICDAYAAMDSRIHVIHQKNAGVSAARNAGLDAASGRYIGFVDADDWIAPEMFQMLFSVAAEKCCDIVMCDAITAYADGRTEPDTITQLDQSCVLNKKDISSELLMEMAGSVCRCLYRAEMLYRYKVKFSSGIKFSEDRIFNILSFGYTDCIAYEKFAYYSRFINPKSAVHRFHADYFEACLAAASGIEGAIAAAWENDTALQSAYLRQLVGSAFAAVCNYYYKTSPLSKRERRECIQQLCQNSRLRKAIECTGTADIRAKWILHQNVGMLILYAKLANLKHGR